MDLPWGFYLGWDWPWLVFFVVLGLSILLAAVVKRLPVLWVLPGIVLYNGLLWDIPSGWSFLFRLVFVVAVLVAIGTWLLPGRTRLARVPMYLMIGLIIWCLLLSLLERLGLPGSETLWWILGLALLIGLVVLVFATKVGMAIIALVLAFGLLNLSFGLMFDGEGEVAGPSVTDFCPDIEGTQETMPDGYEFDDAGNCVESEEPEEPDASPVACPERFEQDLDPNRRNRFDSDGFEGTPDAKRRQLVAALGHDYRYLDFVAEQLFKRPITGSTLVTDGRKCLNEKGRTLHAKVEGALMASGIETGLAPRNGFNTGMVDDEAVVAKRRGVYGDRKATIYTLADGTKLIVLDRCGNMVLKSKPKGMPEGPTDNPPPPEEDKPPQDTPGGCVEVPGNGIYDCGAKEPDDEPVQQGNVPSNVTGQNPGTGGNPASQPSAQPEDEYTPPPPPDSGSGSGSNNQPPPPVETSAPQPDNPEPSPTQDPCVTNPDWC